MSDFLARSSGVAFGRYVLLRKLGQGAMGVVYQAFDPALARNVALKLLAVPAITTQQSSAAHDAATTRLFLEAQAQARLVHPNVVAVFDVGRAEAGVYMAMELVQGKTLRQWLAKRRRPWRDVVRAFVQAGAGLQAAHQVGLVHRDVKPDNILVDEAGRVRLADFGLAREVDLNGPTPTSNRQANGHPLDDLVTTVVGSGTPAYMAPEQHCGQPVTALSDQYAFCVALFEALVGHRPYEGATRTELVHAISARQVRMGRRMRQVPRWLLQIIFKGLSPHPSDRFASLRDLTLALEEGLGRHRLLALAMVSLIAISMGWWAHFAQAHAHTERFCQQRASAIQNAWSPSVWQAIEDAFLATKLPYARDAANTVQRVISSRLDEWSAVALATCRDAVNMPSRAQFIHECLDDEQAVLTALAKVYSQASGKEVRGAAKFVNGLGHPDECRKRRSLAEEVRERPHEPQALADYIELRRDMRTFVITAELVDDRERRAQLEVFYRRARAVGAPALLAVLAGIESGIAADALDRTWTLRAADQSVLFAEMAHDAQTTWDVLAQALYVYGYMFRSEQDPEEILRLSQAHLRRAGDEPVASAKLCIASAPYLSLHGRFAAAEACLRIAVEDFARILGNAHPETVHAWSVLAYILIWQENEVEAEELLLKVKDAYAELASPSHAYVISALYNLSALKATAGNEPRAWHYISEAKQKLAIGSTDLALYLTVYYNAGIMAVAQGKLAIALDDYQRCEDEAARANSPTSEAPRLACQIARMWILALQGHYEGCSAIDRFTAQLRALTISGYFGEELRFGALAQVRDLALWCNDLPRAHAVDEELARRVDHDHRGGVQQSEKVLEFFSPELFRAKHGLKATVKELQRHLQKRPALREGHGRAITLRVRAALAEALIEAGESRKALEILEEDRRIRQETFGAELEGTWTTEVLRAWALLAQGKPRSSVDLLETIVNDLPQEEQVLRYHAAAWALLAQAYVALNQGPQEVARAVNLAKSQMQRLRGAAPAMFERRPFR